jgi:hypothetical protein
VIIRLLVPTTLVAAGLAVATPAQASEVLSARDAKADATIYKKDGPSTQLRQSIDIRKLTIEDRGSKIRVVVKVKAITKTDHLEQMAFLELRPPAGSSSTTGGDIGFSAQSRALGYAYVNDAESSDPVAQCDPLAAKVQPKKRSFSLDIPIKCVPEGPMKVTLRTYTGYFRSDAGGWSSDVLKVPGTHTLR